MCALVTTVCYLGDIDTLVQTASMAIGLGLVIGTTIALLFKMRK